MIFFSLSMAGFSNNISSRHLRTLDPAVIKTEVEGLNEIADNFRPIQSKMGRVVKLNVI